MQETTEKISGKKDHTNFNCIFHKQKKSKIILNVALFTVSVGIILYFCISNNNFSVLMNILPQLNHFWLLIALISMFFSWLCDSFVIRGILSDMHNKNYSKFISLQITMTGQFFSSITPLGVGGQPMQILYLVRKGLPTGTAISIMVRKFLIYQTTMTVYSLLVIIFKFSMFSFCVPGFIALSLTGFLSQCFIVVLTFMFYINKSFTQKIICFVFKILNKVHIIKNPEKMISSMEKQLDLFVQNNNSMRKNRVSSLKLYLLTFLQLTFLFAIPFLLFKAFKYQGYPVIDMLSTQAFITMISSYNPLPGAAGTTEGSFLILFGKFFQPEIIFSAMILCRFITYYTNIILGFIIIKIRRVQPKTT